MNGSNNSECLLIRPVKNTDLNQLYAMLEALVKHEGLSERFVLTRDRLEKELFGLNADWHCFIASIDNEIYGFCLYTYANINRAFNKAPMIQVDDLYVSQKHRNKGIGSKLIYAVLSEAKIKNCSRLNIWCVKDNLEGQAFYKKVGAEKIDFVDIFKISVE